MLKGSAAVLTHWAGRGEETEVPSLTSWPLAAQGPAGANAPFRKENPPAGMKPQDLISKAGSSYLCLSSHLERGF